MTEKVTPKSEDGGLTKEEQQVIAAEQTAFQNATLEAQLNIALQRMAALALENHRLREQSSPVED